MKWSGVFLLVIGAGLMLYALGIDTAVDIYASKINNIGLISYKQTTLIVGGVLFNSGTLVMLFGKLIDKIAPNAKSKLTNQNEC